MSDNVVGGAEMPGGRVETFPVGSPIPNLKSAEASLGFQNIDLGPMGLDIPGSLMTTLTPPESGDGSLDTSMGTTPISK